MDLVNYWCLGHTTTDTAIESMQFVATKSELAAIREQSTRAMMGLDTYFDQVEEFALLSSNIVARFDS